MKLFLTIFAILWLHPCLAQAALIYSVDVDPDTPGIQDSIALLTNSMFSVDIVLEITDNTSIDLYGVTVNFDDSELSFQLGLSAESPFLNLVSIIPLSTNGNSIEGIEAGTPVDEIGTGPSAPPSQSFVIATLAFTATNPSGDASDFDIWITEGVLDGSFDNDFSQITPEFNHASVRSVPEPLSPFFLVLVGLVIGVRTRTPERLRTSSGLAIRRS